MQLLVVVVVVDQEVLTIGEVVEVEALVVSGVVI
jgi:hypothetical protein